MTSTPEAVAVPPAGEDLLALRQIAEDIATEIGVMVAQMRAREVEVAHTKSTQTDVVTRADLAAERRIAELVAQRRPQDGLLGEEGASVPSRSGLTWVVDPIDGTVNYLYGRESYAVSIAVVQGDARDVLAWQPLAGCVHAPALGVTYRAALGHGAQRNGAALSVQGPGDLSLALVGTGFSYRPDVRARQGEGVARLLPRVRDIRRAGSGALDICDVAGGQLDAHYESGLNPWDVAAAILVATEAGAAVRLTPPTEREGRVILVTAPELAGSLTSAIAGPETTWEQPAYSAR